MDPQEFQTQVLTGLRELKEDGQNMKQDILALKGDLQDFKQDFRDIKQDLRELRTDLRSLEKKMDNGFASMRADFKSEIGDVRLSQKEDHEKLEEIYQARNLVKIKFGWEWSLISFVLAISAAGLTQVFD